MTKAEKRLLTRILVAFVLLVAVAVLDHTGLLTSRWMLLCLYLIPYLTVGWDVLYRAVRNIFHGQVLDENFLMCIATIGAFATREYAEAVAVMLLYQVGELFQSCLLYTSIFRYFNLLQMPGIGNTGHFDLRRILHKACLKCGLQRGVQIFCNHWNPGNFRTVIGENGGGSGLHVDLLVQGLRNEIAVANASCIPMAAV